MSRREGKREERERRTRVGFAVEPEGASVELEPDVSLRTVGAVSRSIVSRHADGAKLPYLESGWGGRRDGAGRKPIGAQPMHTHRPRPVRDARYPLHLTTRVRAGLPSLRQARAHRLLVRTLRAGSDRFGFRLIEYSVQSNHVHMLVEGTDRVALTRGTKGILVRLAKHLNRLWGRNGQVFPDRYHVRELTTPTEVRRALAYVLHNARRHGAFGRGIDPFSSGPWFDGFAGRSSIEREATRTPCRAAADPDRSPGRGDGVRDSLATPLRSPSVLAQMSHWPRATCRPRCWLLRTGWRGAGLIQIDEQVHAWLESK